MAAAIASLLAVALGAGALQQGARETEQPPRYPYRVVPKDALRGHLMEGHFKEPGGVFFDPAAREIYVADMKNALIGIFNERGVPLFAFGGPARLVEPQTVVVKRDGTICVLDSDRTAVKVFSYRGEPQDPVRFEVPATEEREASFARVGFFTLDREGRWYVVDEATQRVLVYDADLRLELVLPSEEGGGSFELIRGIAVADDGRIAVLDYRADPVQIFSPRGLLLAAFGERDIGLANFTAPAAAAFDAEGYLYVVDMLRHDVKIFDSQGGFQGVFGGWFSPQTGGRAPGELLYPVAIAIAPEGDIYVAERFGNRVQIFERLPLEEGRK